MSTIRHHISRLYKFHERRTRPAMITFNWLIIGWTILFCGYLFLSVY
jgi:hypothetical protein